MDLIGTKRFLEAVLPQLGVTLTLTDAMVAKAATVADEVGIFIGEATDLVHDADAIVEAFPAQWQALVREALLFAGQGRSLVAAMNRVVEKASRKLDAIPDRLFPLTVDAPKDTRT